MNLVQKRKLLMYNLEDSYLKSSVGIVGGLPGYQENITILGNLIRAIEDEAVLQELAGKGASDFTKVLKEALAKNASEMSSKMVAYGNNTKDILLINEIKYSYSELLRSTDEDLVTKCKCIHDRANTLVAELTEYGITAAVVTSLQSAITGFKKVMPSTRNGLTNLSYSTARIVQLFKDADQIMLNIDLIIEIVHYSEPVFYNNYKAKRKLPQLSSSHVSLKGVVIDETGAPVKGVSIVISMNGTVVNKKSAKKGGFRVKTLAPGTYLIKASKFGYVSYEVTIPVNNGEMSYVEIILRKL